jgi:hypothetical protein
MRFGVARMDSDMHVKQFVSQASNSVWHGCISSLHACNPFGSGHCRVASPQSDLRAFTSGVHARDSFCKAGNSCSMRRSPLCKPSSPWCRRALLSAPMHHDVHACVWVMQRFSRLCVPASSTSRVLWSLRPFKALSLATSKRCRRGYRDVCSESVKCNRTFLQEHVAPAFCTRAS